MISPVTVLSLASHAPSVLDCLLPHVPVVLVVFFHTFQSSWLSSSTRSSRPGCLLPHVPVVLVVFFHTFQSSWLSSSTRSSRPGCLLPHVPVVLVVFFHTFQSSWLSSTRSSRTELFCFTHSLRPGIALGCPDNHILTSLGRFVGGTLTSA